MTTATTSTRTFTEHRFEVPCPDPWGAVWPDLDVASHWAQQKAIDLGIDTNRDDWCRIRVEDEVIVFVVVEKHSSTVFEDTWNAGWHEFYLELDRQKDDPSHPITKNNPHSEEHA